MVGGSLDRNERELKSEKVGRQRSQSNDVGDDDPMQDVKRGRMYAKTS